MDFSKPRISIYYDVLPQTGMRSDGAPIYINYNLRKLINGENVLKNPGLIHDDSKNIVHLSPINPTKQHGFFDLNILVDYGEDGLGIPLDWKIPKPNCYWAFDTHVSPGSYKYRLDRARDFDHVFLCHDGQIKDFIRDGIPREKIHYLPVAAEPDCYRPYPILEKWDWCFIGHLNNDFRIDLIDRFCREWPLGEKGYLGWRMPQVQGHNVLDDVAKKFSQSRIILNESIKDDLNMRVFEALACKRFLLTEEVPPLLALFKPMTHLDTFRTIDQAVERAGYYLSHEKERNAIAQAGYEEVLAKHTYMHRLKELLKITIQYDSKENVYAPDPVNCTPA